MGRIFLLLALMAGLPGCAALRGPMADYRGQGQPLEAFAEDRPRAGRLLAEYPELESWLRSELVRPLGSSRLAWDDGRPPAGALASHSYLKDGDFVVVQVRRELAAADQLAGLVFEVCNARNHAGVRKLVEGARGGGVSREDFVDGILEMELRAVERARGVLAERMEMNAREREGLIVYNALMEGPGELAGFEEWHRRFSGGAGGEGVREFYGGQFDALFL